MSNHIFGIVSAFAVCISFTTLSQTFKTIDSLENHYQNCLDKGQYMLGCSKTFYSQMDSILNNVYFRLQSTLDPTQQVKLKVEQRSWLNKRDTYFKRTLKEFKSKNPQSSPYGSAMGAQDDAMIMYNDNAKFVEMRVLELLKRLKE